MATETTLFVSYRRSSSRNFPCVVLISSQRRRLTFLSLRRFCSTLLWSLLPKDGKSWFEQLTLHFVLKWVLSIHNHHVDNRLSSDASASPGCPNTPSQGLLQPPELPGPELRHLSRRVGEHVLHGLMLSQVLLHLFTRMVQGNYFYFHDNKSH